MLSPGQETATAERLAGRSEATGSMARKASGALAGLQHHVTALKW